MSLPSMLIVRKMSLCISKLTCSLLQFPSPVFRRRPPLDSTLTRRGMFSHQLATIREPRILAERSTEDSSAPLGKHMLVHNLTVKLLSLTMTTNARASHAEAAGGASHAISAALSTERQILPRYGIVSLFDGCGSAIDTIQQSIGHAPDFIIAAEAEDTIRSLVADTKQWDAGGTLTRMGLPLLMSRMLISSPATVES